MSSIVLVDEAEYLEPVDYNRFGTFPQAALDSVVGSAIGYPAHWGAFTVSQKSAQQVTVSAGHYFEDDLVFDAEVSTDINLTIHFPTAPSDDRWLAIIARSSVVDVNEDRAFETSEDPETSTPVDNSVPVIRKRVVTFTIQTGVASPAPALKPTIAATDACVAMVRVKTSGIQEIVPGEEWRIKSLFEVEARLTTLELRVVQLFEDTASIRTDVANIAAKIKNIPDPRLVAQVIRDVARHNQLLNLPAEARNYYFDQALLKDFWDFTAGGNFRILEGIRFPYTQQFDQTLRLLNYDDPNLRIWNNQMVLPAYDEVTRITSDTGSGVKDISNIVHTVVTAVQHTIAHESIRYGETITVCENSSGWGAVGSAQYGAIFQANGETWVDYGQTSNPWNQTQTAQEGHAEYAVARVIVDTYYETYTTYNTELFGLSGAVYGQTFLSSQVMVATSVDLWFTKVDAAAGDVMLCLCNTNASGAPDYNSVITKINKPRADLVVGRNRFTFQPALLDQGKRYGWFTVTTGNHQLMTNSGNAYTGGSLFISTDGIWAQGSTTEDFTFTLQSAKFRSNRTVVQFESLTLAGGMTEVQMIYKKWAPAATSMVWEVKATGDDDWIPMDDREDNPLANLPPLVQLRAVFLGTPDVAPAIILDAYARAISGRMALAMVAISKLKVFGFTTDEAQIVLNVDNYNPAIHTMVPKIVLAAGTVVTADTIIAEVDPTKPKRTKITAHFNLPAATPSARARVDGTTTSVIDLPFGQDIQLNAY